MKYILIVAVIVSLFFVAKIGIEKTERSECLTWAKQAKQYDGFYLTSWQEAQCEHYGIIIKK